MFQGWLSLSDTGPNEGTLKVYPLIREATAYFLLRPFFKPLVPSTSLDYLAPRNWVLQTPREMDSNLQGAFPGHGQELSDELHPHLQLSKTMIHIPRVKPGDYVLWHCDSIHAVDAVHKGSSDSSVLYIPACPLTKGNAEYLVRQKEAFMAGWPAPDFPGGVGETGHVGRAWVRGVGKDGGRVAMGLGRWEGGEGRRSSGEEWVVGVANRVLGF